MNHSTRCGERGFTLVELMVVSLIIGILVSIGVPVVTSARYVAEGKSCQTNQREIVSCMQAYRSSLGQAPAKPEGTLAAGGSPWYPILVSNYLLTHPQCPSDRALYLLDASGGLVGDNGSSAGFKLDHRMP